MYISNNISTRIKTVAKQKNIAIKDLLSDCNLTINALANMNHGRMPLADNLAKIADRLDCSVDYLLGRTDNPHETSNIAEIITDNLYNIPLYESVSAGFGITPNDRIIDYMVLHIENPSDVPDMLCIKVSGDSMYPKIEDGDTIVVRKQSSVDSGTIAVVLIDGEEAVVKRVKYDTQWIKLISLNPEYPPKLFEGPEVQRIRILGAVKKIIKTL